jgi:hypothetical protein
MTDTQRDRGRVIAILTLLSIMLFAMLSGCSPYYYKSNQPKVTHVLALTEEGDTLKIPINSIKPNVIYNVIGYDYYRPYNHNYYWRPYNHNYNNYKPNNNAHGNSNYNNNSSNNTPTNTTPTIKPAGSVTPPNPVIVNPRKNN